MATKKAAKKGDDLGKPIGKVTHFYDKISVAIIDLKGSLAVGDTIHVKGHTTDFEQPVDSMEVDHQTVETAKKGDVIGVKVSEKVRDGDPVYKK
ncbi:translation elongation factor-like protein [Candidatus Berkelbacteria bacterium]|nr:translation elongation factor-like protein [Candidatus Berkelbacteria bacterium]